MYELFHIYFTSFLFLSILNGVTLKTSNTQDPGEVFPEKLGGGVRPASQNPYPIYDQNLWNSLPYLWPDP